MPKTTIEAAELGGEFLVYSTCKGTNASGTETAAIFREPTVRERTPIHPGEVLLEDFLVPLNLTKYRLTKYIGVPATRIQDIIDGRRGVSADTALRLGRYFGTSAELWMGLQDGYELELARAQLREALQQVKPRSAA